MFHWGCFEKLVFVQLHSDPVPSACATTLTYGSKFESVPFEYGCFQKWIGENSWKTPMKIHGWCFAGNLHLSTPPKLDRSETAIHPYVGSPTGENRTFGGFLKKPLLPSRGYPESLQYLHLSCVSTFPAKDDGWFSMVRVQRLKRANAYGRTSRRFHENLMGNIRRNEDLAWRLAKQHTWQPKSTFYCLAINWMVNQTFTHGKWTKITISIHFFKWLFKVPGRDHIKWNMSVGLGGVP